MRNGDFSCLELAAAEIMAKVKRGVGIFAYQRESQGNRLE